MGQKVCRKWSGCVRALVEERWSVAGPYRLRNTVSCDEERAGTAGAA